MEVQLKVVGGEAELPKISLKLPAILGRGGEADIPLADSLVSRQHCKLFASQGRLMVRDLASLNGTFVGKARVTESEIAPGELLTLGTVTFRAIYGDVVDQLAPFREPQKAAGLTGSVFDDGELLTNEGTTLIESGLQEGNSKWQSIVIGEDDVADVGKKSDKVQGSG